MIRCIAIDDEPLALNQIVRYISRNPSLQLVGAFYSVEEAQPALNENDVQLIFLDIELPNMNGVEFAHQLGEKAPYIIFTTAYPQYAVDGFRLDAIDYLLKPLSIEEFNEAIEKVKRRMSVVHEDSDKEIYVKSSGTVHKVKVSDIQYIKGLGEYVQLCLLSQSTPITTLDSIRRLENELSPYHFMRVHKSYLINLKAIAAATRQTVTINNETIPVGEKYRNDFALYLKEIIQ